MTTSKLADYMGRQTDPTGFYCKVCTQAHEFALYVYSHYDTDLTHTCDICKSIHVVRAGRAYLQTRGIPS